MLSGVEWTSLSQGPTSKMDPTPTLGLPAFQPNWAVCRSPLRRKVLEFSVLGGAMLSADRCGLIKEDRHGECHRNREGLNHRIQRQGLEQGEGRVGCRRRVRRKGNP